MKKRNFGSVYINGESRKIRLGLVAEYYYEPNGIYRIHRIVNGPNIAICQSTFEEGIASFKQRLANGMMV